MSGAFQANAFQNNAFQVDATKGFGQAQADIKALNNGFGQAQALILPKTGLGQAQADIKAVNNGYGQANSTINSANRGYAQAQTSVDTYNPFIVVDSPDGYWPLNDASGTVARALIGPNGTYKSSNITYLVATTIPINSTGVAITATPPTYMLTNSSDVTDTFAFEAWFKVSTTITIPSEFTNGIYGGSTDSSGSDGTPNNLWFPDQRGGNRGLGVSVGTNGIVVEAHGDSNLSSPAVYSGTITTNWHHLVINVISKQPYIYLDGELVRTGLTLTETVYRPTYLMGRESYGPFRGSVSHAALYSTSLTSTQISNHFNNGVIIPRQWAQATALISSSIKQQFGQAQAHIKGQNRGFGQALADIKNKNSNFGQAQTAISRITVTQTGTHFSKNLGFTAVAGRLLIASVGIRNNGGTITGTNGWTVLAQADVGEMGGLLAKIADGGETAVSFTGDGGTNVGTVAIEVAGADLNNYYAAAKTGGINEGTDTAPTGTPTTNAHCIIVGGFQSTAFAGPYTTASTGYIFVGAVTAGNGSIPGDNPNVGMVYKIVPSASGSYTPGISERDQSYDAEIGIFYVSVISTTVTGSGQAAALIRHMSAGQAQALIINTKKSAQAQAKIIGYGSGFGQALASIRRTFIGSGQAQASITSHTPNGQAQAVINQSAHTGQAQANIRVLQSRSANAQALIKHVSPKWGQAQVYVRKGSYGWGQAQTFITRKQGYGLAQCLVAQYKGSGQAQTWIKHSYYGSGQSICFVTRTQGYGQAQAAIKHGASGQAQAKINVPTSNSGQARTFISKSKGSGQAQGSIINRGISTGNAQTFIIKRAGYGQARTSIKQKFTGTGQAQAQIGHIAYAQAQASIASQRYLVKFNNLPLPGYTQSESFTSDESIQKSTVAYLDGSFTEYSGLQNKIITLRLKILSSSLLEAKKELQVAGAILRSTKGFTPLYVQYTDKHYLALTRKIETENNAKTNTTFTDYTVEFEAKPWLIGETTWTISGTSLIDTGLRDYRNGGWTPARIKLSGTDITVSGYNELGEFTGFISVSGIVTNLMINTEAYSATMGGVNKNNIMKNLDYSMYVGPGKTYFVIDGATVCEISWEDRYYL